MSYQGPHNVNPAWERVSWLDNTYSYSRDGYLLLLRWECDHVVVMYSEPRWVLNPAQVQYRWPLVGPGVEGVWEMDPADLLDWCADAVYGLADPTSFAPPA